MLSDDTYLDLLNQSPTYISQYVNTKKIPEILKMFALNQSNTIPLVSMFSILNLNRMKSINFRKHYLYLNLIYICNGHIYVPTGRMSH